MVWFTRDNTVRNVYELSTREAVSGLQPQAMVRYRGIAVGKVASIDFDPKVKGNVRVRITVDERVPLTTSTFATLSYQGVTGLAFIALDDKGESQVSLMPDNDDPPRIPLRPSMLAQLQERGEGILNQVEEVTKRINRCSATTTRSASPTRWRTSRRRRQSANQLTRSLDNTVKTRLDPALASIPPLVDTARETLMTSRGTATRRLARRQQPERHRRAD